MKRQHKIFFLLLTFFGIIFTTGCIDKTFKPEAALEVADVTPYELTPTATDTASLPTTAITVNSINTIPANLKSYTISYFTKNGDPIPSLSVGTTPINLKLAAAGNISVTLKPYSAKVVELYELSNSDISPISAKITLYFEDYNDNIVIAEGSCLLYKFEGS